MICRRRVTCASQKLTMTSRNWTKVGIQKHRQYGKYITCLYYNLCEWTGTLQFNSATFSTTISNRYTHTGSLHLLLQEQEGGRVLLVGAAAQGYSDNCMHAVNVNNMGTVSQNVDKNCIMMVKCILHEQSYLNRFRIPTMLHGTTRTPNEVLLRKTWRNERAVCNRVHGALQWPQLGRLVSTIHSTDRMWKHNSLRKAVQHTVKGDRRWKENSSHTLLHGRTPIAACVVVQVDSSRLVLGRKIAHHLELDDSDVKQIHRCDPWMWVMVFKFWKSKYQRWVLAYLHTTHPRSLTNWPWSHFHRQRRKLLSLFKSPFWTKGL